jgi:hypothetical protein
MQPIDKTDWEILNATADDWENLEQIYTMVCFDAFHNSVEISGKGNSFFRPIPGAPTLEELANRIRKLVEGGLLSARLPEIEAPVLDLADPSYIWRAWFAMTPQGRNVWASSEYGATV